MLGISENTSLPVGGKDTHCVLSAHTGLSDKKLFTDLVLLKKGDLFYIQVLDRDIAYEVDQIRVVRPEDTSLLRIIPEKDLVTLVTCTPYGINSHRLLVRGHRVTEQKNPQKAARKKQTASPWMRQYVLSILIGMAFLMVFSDRAVSVQKEEDVKRQRLIFFLFLLVGMGFLNYPFVSQWVNQRNQSKVIYEYEKKGRETVGHRETKTSGRSQKL